MCRFERKTILYIAVSVDGYIADEKGSVGWICGHDDNVTTEDTFTPFFNDVDTVIMGRITYNQIVNELSPNQWPYIGAKTFVITHNIEKDDSENDVSFCDVPASKLVAELRQSNGKNIWICVGAQTVRELIAEDMIDTYHLSIIPVVLGKGIKLFDSTSQPIELTLTDTKIYNGIIELIYNRRNARLPLVKKIVRILVVCEGERTELFQRALRLSKKDSNFAEILEEDAANFLNRLLGVPLNPQ